MGFNSGFKGLTLSAWTGESHLKTSSKDSVKDLHLHVKILELCPILETDTSSCLQLLIVCQRVAEVIEELTASICRNTLLASTLYDVTFRKVLPLKAKIWPCPILHTNIPWYDDIPAPGSEIHTDLHRLLLSLSIRRKKKSHNLWGPLDKVVILSPMSGECQIWLSVFMTMKV